LQLDQLALTRETRITSYRIHPPQALAIQGITAVIEAWEATPSPTSARQTKSVPASDANTNPWRKRSLGPANGRGQRTGPDAAAGAAHFDAQRVTPPAVEQPWNAEEAPGDHLQDVRAFENGARLGGQEALRAHHSRFHGGPPLVAEKPAKGLRPAESPGCATAAGSPNRKGGKIGMD
jgi:hypothetical protein